MDPNEPQSVSPDTNLTGDQQQVPQDQNINNANNLAEPSAQQAQPLAIPVVDGTDEVSTVLPSSNISTDVVSVVSPQAEGTLGAQVTQPNVAVDNSTNVIPSQPDVAQAPPVSTVDAIPVASPNDSSVAAPPVTPLAPVVPPVAGQVLPQATNAVASVPTSSKKKLPKWLIPALAGVVAILIALFVYLFVFSGSMKLESYSGDGYSILVPSKYEKVNNSSILFGGNEVSFVEKLDEKNRQSGVTVSSASVGDVSDDTKQKALEAMDEKLEDYFKENSPEGLKVSNVHIEKVKQAGKYEARKMTLAYSENNKKIYDITGLLIYGKSKVYTVMVLAHSSDSDIKNNANKIIDSFDFN